GAGGWATGFGFGSGFGFATTGGFGPASGAITSLTQSVEMCSAPFFAAATARFVLNLNSAVFPGGSVSFCEPKPPPKDEVDPGPEAAETVVPAGANQRMQRIGSLPVFASSRP